MDILAKVDDNKWQKRGVLSLFGIVHTALSATYIFVVVYASVSLNTPLNDSESSFNPGQLQYLTIWNIILQAIFFFVCLINDFTGSNELNPIKRSIPRRLKDYTHASLGFPVAMFVGITFWGLMLVDRELVLPAAMDAYFPTWLNHLMHSMIVATTLLEMVIAPRQYPKRLSGLLGLLIFLIVYLIWLLIIYANSGIWVYPVMEVLSWPLRVVFFLVLFLFAAALYMLGELLDRLIWGNAKKTAGKSDKKKKSK